MTSAVPVGIGLEPSQLGYVLLSYGIRVLRWVM
jgi:hypothetical protein